MRCAVIENGIVSNIIVADANVDKSPIEGAVLVNVDDTVQIGYTYDNGVFTDPNPPKPPEPIKIPVPAFITRRQCSLELLARNMISLQEALDMTKTAAVPSAIKAIFDSNLQGDARLLAEIDFAAANYYRANSLLSMMGMPESDIDQFFIEAEKR